MVSFDKFWKIFRRVAVCCINHWRDWNNVRFWFLFFLLCCFVWLVCIGLLLLGDDVVEDWRLRSGGFFVFFFVLVLFVCQHFFLLGVLWLLWGHSFLAPLTVAVAYLFGFFGVALVVFTCIDIIPSADIWGLDEAPQVSTVGWWLFSLFFLYFSLIYSVFASLKLAFSESTQRGFQTILLLYRLIVLLLLLLLDESEDGSFDGWLLCFFVFFFFELFLFLLLYQHCRIVNHEP